MGKPSITFENQGKGSSKQDKAGIAFDAWNGRPQIPRRQVEFVTRLGGQTLVMSNIKRESTPTQVVAYIGQEGASSSVAIKSLQATIKSLEDNIGTRFTWTDEGGETIPRCYIVDLSYTIKAVDGPVKALATIQMTIMVDEETK